jgi:hypothetical protein
MFIMGSDQSSQEYSDVKIMDIINEYTVQIQVTDVNRINKTITATLKDIQPYDWTILEQLERSKSARKTLNTYLTSTKKCINATVYKTENMLDECVLKDVTNKININDWMIAMGHVRRKI